MEEAYSCYTWQNENNAHVISILCVIYYILNVQHGMGLSFNFVNV